MKITFRQGIVSRQSGQFLQVVGDNVDLLAVNRSTTVTIAIRDTDYTHSEDNTVPSAWVGQFPVDANPADANAYLYWDFDPLTFERTFGWTTLPPAAQSIAPGSGNTPIIGVVPTAASPVIQGSFEVSGQYVLTTGKTIAVVSSDANDGLYTVQSATYSTLSGTTTIVVKEAISSASISGSINLDFDIFGQPLKQTGRTWYDTANHIHYELNVSNQWVEVIRVFAARLNNANSFFSMSINSDFTGSQIGDVSSVFAGRVLFAESNKPITRDDGTFFTTEDQFFTNQSRVDALRLESNVSRAKSVSGGTLAAFGIVQWVGDGEITTAQYNDTGDTVVGVLTEDTIAGEVGAVIVQGTVTNPDWSWDSALVGKALWIKNGELVSIDPHLDDPINHLTPQVPVARVLSGDTVIFEQGLGGTGPQGPKGTISDLPLANNELVQGVVSLSHAPLNDLFPIAAGENHPVLTSGPYSVDGHGHTAAEISFETIPGSIASTDVQGAIEELNDKKLSLTGGIMSGILTLSGPPSDDLDAATKAYVDALAQGLDAKESALVGTTADFGGSYVLGPGLEGVGDNIANATISSLDGIYGTDYSLIVGSRILVKDQTDTLQNGIYVVTSLNGSPPTLLNVERSSDFDENDEVRAGNYVFIRGGDVQAGTGWVLTDIHPGDDIDLNDHPIIWTLISSATSFTADETTITIDGLNVISTKQASAGGTVDALKWNSQEFSLVGGSPPAIGEVITFNGTTWENSAAAGGGDLQTPWLSNIDTAGFDTFTQPSTAGIGISIITGASSDRFTSAVNPSNNIHLAAGNGTGNDFPGSDYGKGGNVILQPGISENAYFGNAKQDGMIELRSDSGYPVRIGTSDSFTATNATSVLIEGGDYKGGTGTRKGGDVFMISGATTGTSAAGFIKLISGNSDYGFGGNIGLYGGTGNYKNVGPGSQKDGGEVRIEGGRTRKRGHGGNILITAGENYTGTYTDSYGGRIKISGGDSVGVGAVSSPTAGYGLSGVTLKGGNNTGAGSEGGHITLIPGIGGAGGTIGEVWIRGADSYIGTTAASATLRLFDEQGGNIRIPFSVSLKPPTLSADTTFELPNTSGTAGEVLTATGGGGTNWASAAGGGVLPDYEKIIIGGSPVSQTLTTAVTVTATAGSPIQSARIQVFRNGILQNEDTTTGGGIDGDFEVTGPNELTFSADSLQPGGVVIIYVFS